MVKRYLLVLLLVTMLVASFALPVMAGDIKVIEPVIGQELVGLRTENTKTFDLGNGHRKIVASVGAVHYKDDYSNPNEAWKDIDLTWVGNRVTKAPYELTLDNDTLTLRDKKTGQVSTITLLSKDGKPNSLVWLHENTKAKELTSLIGNNIEVILGNTSVSFRQTTTAIRLPFEAQYRITGAPVLSEVINKQYYLEGNAPVFTTKAFDDDGELRLDATFKDGVLTERIDTVVDGLTGKARIPMGTIKVDPTWQVGTGTDDCRKYDTSGVGTFSPTDTVLTVGYYDATYNKFGNGMRFTNITIPSGSTVDNGTYLSVYANTAMAYNSVYSYVSAEDTDDAATFSTLGDFNTRYATRTTDNVSWGPIAAWTNNTWYNSPEIKTVIQEVVSRGDWLSGNDIVIFWDDFTDRSTHTDFRLRQADAYEIANAEPAKLVIEYTPPAAPPIVTNSAADNISETTADFHGEITDVGSDNPTIRGFVWDIDSGLPYSDNWSENGDYGVGTFDHTVTDLPPDTTIYWRAYATNDIGTGYSGELFFDTLLPLPLKPDNLTITKTDVDSISVTWDLGLWADNVTFRIQEDSYPTSMTDGYELYAGAGTSTTKTGLSLGTSTYYISGWCSNLTGDSIDYAKDSIGGESMVWLFIVGLAGILSFVSVSRRNVLVALAASISWIFLFAYTRDNPIPGVTVGTFTDTLIIFLAWGMALALPLMSIMSARRERSLSSRGYAVTDTGNIAGNEREAKEEPNSLEAYRAKVHRALHPRRR